MRWLPLLLVGCAAPAPEEPWWDAPWDTAQPRDTVETVRFYGELRVGTTEGGYGFSSKYADGTSCELSYAFAEVHPVGGCDPCELGFALTLGALEVRKDRGGCDAASSLRGETVRLGSGGGRAFERVDGTWEEVGRGELDQDLWFFEYYVD